jgi:AcrR family transcriptional regulator
MREDKRHERHQAITAAAYDLLARHGYGGTSMLAIAGLAKASNETLYRWYGDKRGLFEAMVRDNAAQTKQALEQSIAGPQDAKAALHAIAPVFLQMILGERAVLLNRAAAADPSAELGRAIAAGGRGAVMPLIEALMARLETSAPAAELAESFVALLLGPQQILRLIGVTPEPSEAQIAAQCHKALAVFFTLIAAEAPSSL